MEIHFDFNNGPVEGFFVIFSKKGQKRYATKIFRMGHMLRAFVYFTELPNGRSFESHGGEMRILIEDIEKIEIRNRQY